MKTTIIALSLGLASLTFAQTPAPAANTKTAPATVKAHKKHVKKAVKKTAPANSAATVPAPVK